MKKQDAQQIIQSTFESKFEEQKFHAFVANLFKSYTPLARNFEEQYVREAFRPFILKYKVVGHRTDAEGKTIDILQVLLKKNTSLDRARTAQRNFVADYLKHYQKGAPNTNGTNAALVAFVAPEEDDWRLSLVKLEYTLEERKGKLKSTEDITPAKRWSFLVGINESNHTAKSRFISLLQNNQEPTLAELEEAFNIEKVTNEFFGKYCELFLRMKEALDDLLEKDTQLKRDFESKEISTVDFAKKTLGQMAFLYFLQKKGWFGVKAGEVWGKGIKNFLRELFNRREKYGKNFFDDVLEPLFYEALAQDRGKESIYPRLNNCRMPFLNGGLFEPMNGYAWETTYINLPDDLFSNTNKTKEGDIGDGILDVFDRYNFTVNENEPLEKEVAVDPEMLGKVFENLLEIKDRKSKGAFYTPREIVHYMCQESLINYLHSEAKENIPREDIELFIQKGDLIIQNDKTVLEKGRETDTYKFMLPKTIREKAKELDQYLENIKVCDPAVGSGAFPLGMLNEVVRARQALGIHTRSALSPYDLKLHTISNSIYGVDIDSGAVEIAKLRMWLALVVEEKDPHPLPNLEHKIMQGNSLISEYEGIKLFDESLLEKNDSKKTVQLGLNFGTTTDRKIEELQHLTESFIHESQRSKKQELKNKIDILKWELIEATLEEQGREDKLGKIRELRRKNIRPFFIWKLEFSDVFQQKGGFDVVIGNPPYVNTKNGISDEEKESLKKSFRSAIGQFDLFSIFMELGLSITNNGITYIIPKPFINNENYQVIREIMIGNGLYEIVIGSGIFESASVESCIFFNSKKNKHEDVVIKEFDHKMFFTKNKIDLSTFLELPFSMINTEISKDDQGIFEKLKQNIRLLGGILSITRGVECGKKDESVSKVVNDFKLLRGQDVGTYLVNHQGCYIDFDERDVKKFKLLELYKNAKILIRRVGNQLVATFDRSGAVVLNTLYCANSIDPDFENRYIVALLNSKLIFFFFKKTFVLTDKLFPYVRKSQLDFIPIKKISSEAQKPFIELVDQILAITSDPDYDPKKTPVRQKEIEARIDEMVFDLYELTEEEREVVLKS
ncbi:Eco57I restriction-modification methylase domain-containing protein [Candidatus Gracilibacteria bacterium]|nr:Eco57I restriction-modification methylase domain-containing protein [Candidatus Gracilibacteria bacterium]